MSSDKRNNSIGAWLARLIAKSGFSKDFALADATAGGSGSHNRFECKSCTDDHSVLHKDMDDSTASDGIPVSITSRTRSQTGTTAETRTAEPVTAETTAGARTGRRAPRGRTGAVSANGKMG